MFVVWPYAKYLVTRQSSKSSIDFIPSDLAGKSDNWASTRFNCSAHSSIVALKSSASISSIIQRFLAFELSGQAHLKMIRANKNATALCPCLIFYPATFVIRSVGVVIKQVLNLNSGRKSVRVSRVERPLENFFWNTAFKRATPAWSNWMFWF